MCIMMPVVAAVVLVFMGYIALWTAGQNGVEAGVAKFGKILAIILFVFAGLALVGGAMHSRCRCHGMPGEMGMRPTAFMRGQTGCTMCDTVKMGTMEEKNQTGAPAPMPMEGKNKK